MFAPVLLYCLVFKYLPMGGLVIAFKNYNIRQGILGSPWMGLRDFRLLLMGTNTLNITRNTL